MSNEIKVGDKVRVREDAPRVYLRRWSKAVEYDVYAVDGDAAAITYGYQEIVIPLKYLVKVDAEAKETRFKRGDKVVSKPPFVEKVWTVFGYDDKMPYMVMVGDGEYINERNLEPYTEPTKQTEVKTKTKGDTLVFPVSLDLQGSYWQVYEADLAKEIALKVANKYNDPKETAEYAVSVAKAVVDGLKTK